MDAKNDIAELDAAGLRRFALTTSAIVIVLFGLVLPWVFDLSWPRWPWVFGLVLAVWGLLAPTSLRPIYIIWMRFGLLMHRITSPLILGAVFYLAITPVAMIMKVIGRDSLRRKLDKHASTYRVLSKKSAREKMEKPF